MRRLGFAALAAALALLASGCMTLVYLKQGIAPGLFFNSDALYLPALYYDLFERGGHLRQWFLTPAPYFFPDWPLYFGLRALTGDVYRALAGVMALQALLLWGLAALIMRRFTGGANALAAAALALAAVCWGGLNGAFPYTYIMLASYHFGTFLALLLSLAWLLPLLQRPQPAQSRAALAALALLAAATTLSDRLYLVQCALPALAALLLLRRRLPDWRRLCLALALGCVAGVLLSRWKLVLPNPAGMPWKLAPRHLGANLHELAAIFEAVCRDSPALALFVAVYYALLLALAPGTLRGRGWRWSDPTAAWLALFNLAGTGGLLTVMALSSVTPTVRYLIPAFVLPLLLAPALGHAWFAQRRAAAAVPARSRGHWWWALAALALCVPLLRMAALPGPVQREYYPPDIACADRVFEQYDLRYGLAGYWDASSVAMTSRRKPVVAPMTIDLRPLQWITTGDNFRQRYDFALVTPTPPPAGVDDGRPAEALIVRHNGAPLASVVCGALKILVYPRQGLHDADHGGGGR